MRQLGALEDRRERHAPLDPELTQERHELRPLLPKDAGHLVASAPVVDERGHLSGGRPGLGHASSL